MKTISNYLGMFLFICLVVSGVVSLVLWDWRYIVFTFLFNMTIGNIILFLLGGSNEDEELQDSHTF